MKFSELLVDKLNYIRLLSDELANDPPELTAFLSRSTSDPAFFTRRR